VGHGRGAAFGDALSNLLAFTGYAVTREYYVNDAGAQVDTLARSAFLRYREALGQDIGEIPAGLHPGDYLKPVGKALADAHGPSLLNLPEARRCPWRAAVAAMLAMIKADLAALVSAMTSSSPSAPSRPARTRWQRDRSRKKGLVFQGRLEKPKGHDDADRGPHKRCSSPRRSGTISTARC
jgi:arginyl-tRNA synthetase